MSGNNLYKEFKESVKKDFGANVEFVYNIYTDHIEVRVDKNGRVVFDKISDHLENYELKERLDEIIKYCNSFLGASK